ncbi:MAG: hydrogenase/urease maturation nickel metallochaperone HypA [Thermoplasmata archaeon]|nr:hydrogenase/urease maturation nickel metallochaperone HypA [Thermoplasmata archaeon]
MHEYSTTAAVVSGVLAAASEAGATRVLSVHLSVGELTFLAGDQLRTAFIALTRGTIAEGAELDVEVLEGRVACRECGFEGRPPAATLGGMHYMPLTLCPECGGVAVVTGGKECLVAGVEAEVPDENRV